MTSTNNNNNTNSSNSQRSTTNIKKEYIQKLSNDKALAEAIIIGKKPCLAIVDFSNGNTGPETVPVSTMDSLAQSEDTRLVPELLNNRPYSFKNKEEFESYIERARHETLDSLFDKTLSIWKKYIDADDFHLKICAADTMFTYKQDVIGTTHYLFFIADNDAGKSNNLKLFNILAYRNLMNTSMTHANIYNFLGPKEEGVGTICIDEADNIDQNHEIMAILKSGYTKGFPVVRIIDTPHGRKQVKFNTYGFKAMAGERLPDEVEARGFMQRTIVIKCFPGFPKHDISEVTDPAGDDEYQDLLHELNELRNLLFCHRLIHFKDKIPNIKLNIHNREKQLFKPLLRIFQGYRTFDTLRPVISKYINDRRENKANSLHAFLYRIIRDLTKSRGTLQLDFTTIWDFLKMNVEWKDIPYKAQSIETVEFGVISQKQVGSILKNVFGGEPPKHKGSNRKLVFSQYVLGRMKDIYESIEIEVDFATTENLDNHTRFGFGDDGADGALSGSIQTQTAPSESKNDSEIETTGAHTRALSQNVPQVPQVPQLDKNVNDNCDVSIVDDDDDDVDIDDDNDACDLRNQDGADRFRAQCDRLKTKKDKNGV